MDRFNRIYELHKILKSHRYPVPMSTLREYLECSQSTAERCIKDMRELLGAPIEYDREHNGYHYARGQAGPYELPGLWFNASELAALCVLDNQLAHIEPGLLADELAPARKRINHLMDHAKLSLAHLRERVRILGMAYRQPGEAFHTCADALLRQRQLTFTYHARSKNQTTQRTVSPQRITHYRDNWYLDAWCHSANALRTFSMDRISKANCDTRKAKIIDNKTLNNALAMSYGIFAGPATNTAILLFSKERARWVADETWHPKQNGHHLPDGTYQLAIPYGDDRELIGEILRHGTHVIVQAPEALRQRVAKTIANMQKLYK